MQSSYARLLGRARAWYCEQHIFVERGLTDRTFACLGRARWVLCSEIEISPRLTANRTPVANPCAIKTSGSTDSASMIHLGAFFYRPRASLRNEADEILVVFPMTRATAPSSSARPPRSPASTLTASAITGSA